MDSVQSCGGGRRRKVRECVLPRSVEGCEGEAELEESCNDQTCPSWTAWTSWTQCTLTCGGGTQRRDRQCLVQETRGGQECPGEESETRDCSQQNCPVFNEWSEWSACTKTCGGGQRTAQRECVVPKSGDQSLCVGDSLRSEECNTAPCTTWTSWASWTSCTKSCGTGSRRRVRECTLDYQR